MGARPEPLRSRACPPRSAAEAGASAAIPSVASSNWRAGTFGSAEDALAEWRGAVGETADGARLSPCPGALAAWLLGPLTRSGPLAEMLTGYEHRELIREYFRSRRRGQLLLASLPGDGQEPAPVLAAEINIAPFVDWYDGQHADAPKLGKFRKQAVETARLLLDAWGPHEHPAEETDSGGIWAHNEAVATSGPVTPFTPAALGALSTVGRPR